MNKISFLDFIVKRKSQLLNLTLEHIGLSLIAIIIAVIIGIPLGILIFKRKKLTKPIMGMANVAQAIPSIALLGFLIPFLGIGSKPSIIMVVIYSLLPILKNTYTALNSINPDTVEAARGMGMTNNQILRIVQLPLSLPIIMAGIRISAVTAIGLMTIAAFIGAGGLGYLVFTGVQTVDNNMILAGAIPACILALLMDFIIGKIENSVTPAGITTTNLKGIKRKKHTLFNPSKAPKIISAILIIAIIIGTIGYFITKKDKIVIGSKNYNEQLILGNMLAELIENNTNLKVEKKLNLGGTSVAFTALKSGELDMYPEYTGTALISIMKKPIINNPSKVYNVVKDYYNKNFNISWLKPLGFNNTYTLAITQSTAKKYNLKTISDLSKVSSNLNLGCNMEFTGRKDGLKGLESVYNTKFNKVKAIDGGLRYTSLKNKKTDVADAFSTEGLLKAFNLKVLKDDKHIFPPYYPAPIIRNETLKKHPELKPLINKLSGKISEKEMRNMNYKVDKLGKSPENVASQFLKSKNLIK
ncbi:glycine betaine ABC transporter substrate-binding protein [Clostridium oceanicum]|uniref:Glycine betaine ABC transporter substrate-binding protein n=1 Tax=Clostridium oceanicum TaxID=1543 RepID=A0ABN1JGJ2_9CLOT